MAQVNTAPAKKILQDFLSPLLEKTGEKILVIGIDGPTAVGKTIFADILAGEIPKISNRPAWVYRLDWHLVEREKRTSDLKNLISKNKGFALEGELHMQLDRAISFLKEVRKFNESLQQGDITATKKIILENLYSRADQGKLVGKTECLLQKGLVILVEGHYTLKSAIDNLTDYNILLLGTKEELLKRKIARVKDYRGNQEAEDYFWRVDLPSFSHHLKRFGTNASLIIDNTDTLQPKIKETKNIKEWLTLNTSTMEASQKPEKKYRLPELGDHVLSHSQLVDKDLRTAFKVALELVLQWDQHIGQYLRLSIENIDSDLTSLATKMIDSLPHRLILRHSNALYNVYNRSLPITIGLEIEGSATLYLLVDSFHDFLRIQIAWMGGYQRFAIERQLGEIKNQDPQTLKDRLPFYEVIDQTQNPLQAWECKEERIFTPIPFTVPSFLNHLEGEATFSGLEEENISAAQALVELADKGGVLIHRFAKFCELNFFYKIFENIGASPLKVGNYLMVVWSKNDALHRRFRNFKENWRPSLLRDLENSSDEAKLDEIIDEERKQLYRFVEKNCPDFTVLDGYLHCQKITPDIASWQRILNQVSKMLLADSRLSRKRAVQFIGRYFPDLTLETRKMWDDLEPGAKNHISLDALTSLSPSILAEVYLWLSLREEPSAILGANIYDIRKNSFDCRAYLKAATTSQTPIVLQGSLNALGEGTGYLKSKDGALDLVEAAMNAARDILLLDGSIPPLFGIGLDHVDAAHNRPKGHAKSFLQKAIHSECVTHFVLDGSALFCAQDQSRKELETAFKKITQFEVDLLGENPHAYIYDKEVCTGELNYFGATKKAMIPTAGDMELFVDIFKTGLRQSGLGALNTRPTLFVGNLGTTHHGFDSGEIAVENAKLWIDRVKKENFVSAVLHGTTNTHPHILSKATLGCHKVNVAGDFLNTLIKALPERLCEKISPSLPDVKTRIPQIRPEMDLLSSLEKKNISDSLKAHCRSVLDNINAPKLSPLDVKYFRYKNYKFTKKQVEVIGDAILQEIKSYSLNPKKIPASADVGYQFSASMIEVPFDEDYKKLTDILWKEGVRYFHVDVGDGKFIPRQFSGLQKTKYLRETFPQSQIHCHLMVENPHFAVDGLPSIIEQYIEAGCHGIALHKRAFSKERYFFSALDLIKKLGAKPGVIIETSETLDTDLENWILEIGLDWAVIMGVPVGYGGQIFDMTTLKNIAWFHQFSISHKKPFLIEMDGGLTLENILLCKKSGAQIFSGWSIVKADTTDNFRKKIKNIHKLIS